MLFAVGVIIRRDACPLHLLADYVIGVWKSIKLNID